MPVATALRHTMPALAAIAALALAGCSGGEEETERQGVLAVGSSTVFPFAEAIAGALEEADPDLAEITLESIGTTEGIERFCAGTGLATPDVVHASRRMTAAEFEACRANGVADIAELQVGIDGLVFVSSTTEGLSLSLTPAAVYRALAAEPFGEEQTAQTWADVDPALPDADIEVYGPPETSGTRDSLKELVLETGCLSGGTMGGLQVSDPARFEAVCDTLRSDSAYLAQGEDDELIVRKVANNPLAIAILGYSYFEEHQDELQALPMNGVAPTAETIAGGTYPAARPLYIYVKKAHLELVPGLRAYVDQWAENWGEDGLLAGIGLIAAPEAVRTTPEQAARELPSLTEEDLAGGEVVAAAD